MTREEAIKLRLDHIGPATKAIMPAAALQEITAAEIDFYIATGMLKLDEPKSAPQDKIKALAKELSNVASGCTCFDCLTKTLDRHGLRIVEK